MASYEEHFSRAISDLQTLKSCNHNKHIPSHWQVTMAYYIAVQLVDAHFAKSNYHPENHDKRKLNFSPYCLTVSHRADDITYADYVFLENLSRRARYMCNDNGTPSPEKAVPTRDKQLTKAFRLLDTIMKFMTTKHGVVFPIIDIHSTDFTNINTLKHFKVIAATH